MRLSTLALSGLLAFAATPLAVMSPASAQSVLSGTETYLPQGLTRADLALIQKAAGQLAPEGPRDSSWFNEKNGHGGTVSFVKSTKQKGMPCRIFRYTFRTTSSSSKAPYELTWCRTPQGEKIAN